MSLKHTIKPIFYRVGLRLLPVALFQIQHWLMHRRFGTYSYWANLHNPETFNEKLLRSKLDGDHAELTHLVDKAAVKSWVSERIGEEHIIETIGVYDDPEQVPLNNLPRHCILKPTHASGHVIILRGTEGDPTPKEILKTMKCWQRINHYHLSGEPQYRDIAPRIICEPLLGDGASDLPDYKFFCFHGEPAYIQVDIDRHSRHVRRYYDCDWQPQDFTLRYPMARREAPRPERLDRMLDIAQMLSAGFNFVRVDLYESAEQVYFGELTFHPESGTAPFSDYQKDLMLGKLLELREEHSV